jgi:hypothetical protein
MQNNGRSQDLHERIGRKTISVGGSAANSGCMLKKKASYADISMSMEKADWFLKADGFRVMAPGDWSISGWRIGFILPACLDDNEGRNPQDRM